MARSGLSDWEAEILEWLFIDQSQRAKLPGPCFVTGRAGSEGWAGKGSCTGQIPLGNEPAHPKPLKEPLSLAVGKGDGHVLGLKVFQAPGTLVFLVVKASNPRAFVIEGLPRVKSVLEAPGIEGYYLLLVGRQNRIAAFDWGAMHYPRESPTFGWDSSVSDWLPTR